MTQNNKDEIDEKMIHTDRHEIVNPNTTKLRSMFTPLESNQRNPGLLKVVDLRPQSDGHRVSGPHVILG